MSRYLLDTNHVSAVHKGQLVLTRHPRGQSHDEFAVCIPSVGELWYMVFNSSRVNENTATMRSLLAQFQVVEFDDLAAQEFGRIKTELRKLGKMIPDLDIQIASVALISRRILLTDDSHFAQVQGLTIDNWVR